MCHRYEKFPFKKGFPFQLFFFNHDADPAGDTSPVSYAILINYFLNGPDPAGDASPVGKGCF
jgi:hypothetical protein